MNIIISSWSGAGGTTRALLLCYITGFDLIEVGSVRNFLAGNVIGNHEQAHLQFENSFGIEWDNIWEKYIKQKIKNDKKQIIDGTITGFLYENIEDLFEVMVIANSEIRSSRASNPNFVKLRDDLARTRWLRKFKVDPYDMSQIELNYDLIIDTGVSNVENDLVQIIEGAVSLHGEEGFDLEDSKEKIGKAINLFQKKGPENFRKKIKKRIYSPKKVLKEWNKDFYPEVEKLSEPLQNFIKQFN